jgi:hypothetical protein
MNDIPLEVLREYYGQCSNGSWVYEPPALEFHDRRRSPDEICQQVDQRPLDELRRQAKGALIQILSRAHVGDEEAIKTFSTIVHGFTGELENLANTQQDKLRTLAETFPMWPVQLSLKKGDKDSALDYLRKLNVGTKAITPTGPGQKWNRSSFWTELANRARVSCGIKRMTVPALLKLAAEAPAEQLTAKLWGNELKATRWTLRNGDTITLTEWQKECVKLTEPITPKNFAAWWKLVELCVLEHWKRNPKEHSKALREIGEKDKKGNKREHWRQHNMAIDRVRQGFKDLVGIKR